MNVALKRADAHAGARETARADLLERRLKRYQPRFQARVRSLAERHPRLKDLAASFPALLFALAVPRAGVDGARVCERVVSGMRLREIAVAARLPLWLRRLEPEAFHAPIPELPDSPFVGRQVVNFIPRSPWKAGPWMDAVSQAYAFADEAVAIWMAREWRRKDRCWRPSDMRWVCHWAWYARHVPNDPCKIKKAWTPSLSLAQACVLADEWRCNVLYFVELGDEPLQDVWLQPGRVGGFDIVPLRTCGDVVDEARVMKNCIRTYGSYLAENTCRLWSIRRDGERVATLEVQLAQESPFPHIEQVKMANDRRAPEGIWRVARSWLQTQDVSTMSARFFQWGDAPANAKAWRKMWRPYWLAKRRIPDWLPLTPNRKTIDAL